MSTNFNNSNESICENFIYVPNQEFEQIINGIQGYVIWGILFVVIALLGCVGNIIIILVLKNEPKSSLTVLLIALAISDILAPLANALISFSFYHLSNRYGDNVIFLIFNDILRHLIQPLSTMFTMSSSWIVTTTTLFRLIAVAVPFKAKQLINKRYTYFSLILIFGCSSISIIPLYASLHKKQKCAKGENQQLILYEAFDMAVNSELMVKFYLPTIQSLSFYIPWLISLILWLFLLRSLRKSEKDFRMNIRETETSLRRRWNNQSSISRFDSLMSLTDSNNLNTVKQKKKRKNINKAESINSSILNRSNITQFEQASSFNRTSSVNKVTLMVVVLCFTNLVCRLFTFVFLFEVIYNEYMKSKYQNIEDTYFNASLAYDDMYSNNTIASENTRSQYPKFMSYSLLLNNVFLCLNHSCNIFIYTFTNPRFKKNVIRLFNNFKICTFFKKK